MDITKVSAANLPDEMKIINPFDKDYLMSLPKEALVSVILHFHEEAKIDSSNFNICPLIGCPCERANEQVGDLMCENCDNY